MKRVHMVGICGVAMGTLGAMLKEIGFQVKGSDKNVYPPMSDMLEKWGIEIYNGFSSSNIKDVDFVIIGNAISRGNPEVEYILNNNIPYISMTEALYKYFLRDKDVIAICGTHGKTTSTALMSHILKFAGEDPSFFIGGISRNYDSNYYIGRGKYFIIEGDEYDSAYFEKTPKFIHYRPNHVVLTSLEFDHADIYNNIEEIKLWFKRLVNLIPGEGYISYNKDYTVLDDVTAGAFSKKVTYGAGKNSTDYSIEFQAYEGDFSLLKINKPDSTSFNVKTRIWGDYNYSNIIGVVSMALSLGISEENIAGALETFGGVKRRQDLIYSNDRVKIYEDFAHHPTAIEGTLKMMRDRFPDRKLIALYEPRSATSRRNIFQKELSESFTHADYVYLKTPYLLDKIPENERLDISEVSQYLNNKDIETIIKDDADLIVDDIYEKFSDTQALIVIMSNGGFDNIYSKIKEKFDE